MQSNYEHGEHRFDKIDNDIEYLSGRLVDLARQSRGHHLNAYNLDDKIEVLDNKIEELQQVSDSRIDATVFDLAAVLAFALGVLAGEMSLTLWCLSVCVAGRMAQLLHPRVMTAMAVMKDWMVCAAAAADQVVACLRARHQRVVTRWMVACAEAYRCAEAVMTYRW